MSLTIPILILIWIRLSDGQTECGKVHLTISSYQANYIELNWINCESQIISTINLYNSNPRNGNSKLLVSIKAKDYPEGYYRTKVKINFANYVFTKTFYSFPYWIASISDSSDIIDAQTLSTNANWMKDNSEQIENIKIGELFIPGTHNAATSTAGFLSPFVKNQDLSVYAQLLFGIRYLDLRVGYQRFRKRFTINHDCIEIQPLIPVLEQIRDFVRDFPDEIIIVHFHRFPVPSNFTPDLHKRLVDLINKQLGEWAFAREGFEDSSGPTLREIWNKKKNLIISYGDHKTVPNYNWLWYEIPQNWGNINKIEQFRDYMKNKVEDHSVKVNWAIMAQLTPTAMDLLWLNTPAKLAQQVNSNITKWFRDEWSNRVNILATDFFLGNNIINVAIEANRRKLGNN